MSGKNRGTLRESASLIIAAPEYSAESVYDFKVLIFKRSKQTAYLRDHCVFPGGVFESADEDEEWLECFQKFGLTLNQIWTLVNTKQGRPHILSKTNSKCPKDLSLRITAIRETFEEVGLLLCRDKQSIKNSKGYGHFVSDNFDKEHWQKMVHSDPKQFLKLCKHLKVVPDIWSLYEWSVWRSPSSAIKKFDTVFYFVALTTEPNLIIEKTEVAEFMWQSPNLLLKAFSNRIVWLPYIQFYELSRLTQLFFLKELVKFSRDRNKKGSTQLMPVYYKCNDGLTGILPGDDLYPYNADDYKETIIIEESLDEFQSKTVRRHRLVFRDIYDMHVNLSIEPIDDHLSPVMIEVNTKSML